MDKIYFHGMCRFFTTSLQSDHHWLVRVSKTELAAAEYPKVKDSFKTHTAAFAPMQADANRITSQPLTGSLQKSVDGVFGDLCHLLINRQTAHPGNGAGGKHTTTAFSFEMNEVCAAVVGV
jgi:hypothetical protein